MSEAKVSVSAAQGTAAAGLPLYAIILTLSQRFSEQLARPGVVEAIAMAASEGHAPAVPALVALGQSPDFATRFVERLAYLIRLREAGTLRAAGPFAGMKEGMYLVHAADEAAARRVLEEDPLYQAGFIEPAYTVQRWLVAI